MMLLCCLGALLFRSFELISESTHSRTEGFLKVNP
jgi:hypothetical protein